MNEKIEVLLRQLTADKLYGHDISPADRIAIIRKIQELSPIRSYELLLPILFTLKGKPLTWNDHRPFSPLFNADRPKRLLLQSGRQVGKSLATAVCGIILPGQNPNFTSLITTPLGEQVRRFSVNYVKPLMQDSPFPFLWKNPFTKSTIYQHEFPNRSNLIFSFASLSADRIRGISADAVSFDEIQDFNTENLPVIESTADASKYGMIQYTGTPKSLDNTINGLWMKSSQAEWVIKCPHCGFWNIPSAEHNLLEMIGPWHPDISEEKPGTICASCKKPINPRFGHWQHRYPERRERFAGYHIPQVIMPLHFANAGKWRTLIEKQQGAAHTSQALFYNEILGESVDAGQKLVSSTDLIQAGCLPWKNNPYDPSEEIMKRRDRYVWTTIAADWSGGGEKGVSFTVLAFMGILPDGTIDVLWGKRMTASLDHVGEAKETLHWMNFFKADTIAHDYTGAGALRETFLLEAGVPEDATVPIMYVPSAKYNLMTLIPPTQNHGRRYFRSDKTRTLLYVIGCLKQGKLRFFQYDGGAASAGTSLMDDFLALIEEKSGGLTGNETYCINRNHAVPDDFAHAVAFGCLTLWHVTGNWPNFAISQQPDATQIGYSYDEMLDDQWDVSV